MEYRTLKENFHTHTARCHHAVGKDRDYVEAAVKAGVRVLGFSDHVPWPFRDGFRSGIRMDMEEIGDYLKSIHELQEEFKGQITIIPGFEAEYFPDLLPAFRAVMEQYGDYYLILGNHFPGGEPHGVYAGQKTADERVLVRYVNEVIAGMETGWFVYVAHPDLIHYAGKGAVYEREMERLCIAAKQMKIPLEINLEGLRRKIQYPSPVFWEIAASVGNDAILGLDAHNPKVFEDKALQERGFAIAEEFKLKLITRPTVMNNFIQ